MTDFLFIFLFCGLYQKRIGDEIDDGHLFCSVGSNAGDPNLLASQVRSFFFFFLFKVFPFYSQNGMSPLCLINDDMILMVIEILQGFYIQEIFD